MQSAPIFSRRGRSIGLLILVVLLHVLVLSWFSQQWQLPRVVPHQADAAVLTTRLLRTPVPVPAQVPPPSVAPAELPPLPEIAPLELEPAAPAPGALEPAFAEAAQAMATGVEATGEQATVAQAKDELASSEGASPSVAETATAATATATVAAQAPPAQPALPQYSVDPPPAAKVTLDVARTDADGANWSGEALLSWQLGADAYRVRIEAGIRLVFARVNLVVLTSEGKLDGAGFAPLKMTEKRRGRAMTATHFDRTAGRITFSSSSAAYPLAPGAQDKASVPLQLAAIARGNAQQLAKGVDILVGEDREAVVYRFEMVGQETIATRMGQLATWHLTRPPKPGSYKSRLDIWLAPEHGWIPVQIRNTEANGAVTTQTVNNIAVGQPGL